VTQIIRQEAAAWRSQIIEARTAAADANAAVEAWVEAGGAAAGVAVVAGAGASRFSAGDTSDSDDDGGGGQHSEAWNWESGGGGAGGSSAGGVDELALGSSGGGSCSGSGSDWDVEAARFGAADDDEEERRRRHHARHRARRQRELEARREALAEDARSALLELLNRVELLRRAAEGGGAYVQRQYDKRLEQVRFCSGGVMGDLAGGTRHRLVEFPPGGMSGWSKDSLTRATIPITTQL
jgi:hypothetical protein